MCIGVVEAVMDGSRTILNNLKQMKIASVTVCMNDYERNSEWHQYYLGYRDDIFLHIIVDNGSNENYVKELENLFSDSVIIKRRTNGGLAAAYNDGIRLALRNEDVDAIALIANDIKLEHGVMPGLSAMLRSNHKVGMVAPIMFTKDSEVVIESYGAFLHRKVAYNVLNSKEQISEALPMERLVDLVPGGMHLSRRELYQIVGLQDETLFMYSDEIDMAIRIRNAGYLVMVTRALRCWHQHQNKGGSLGRGATVYFLQARNRLLVAHKHYNWGVALSSFFTHNLLIFPLVVRRAILDRCVLCFPYFMIGSFAGLLNLRRGLKFMLSK